VRLAPILAVFCLVLTPAPSAGAALDAGAAGDAVVAGVKLMSSFEDVLSPAQIEELARSVVAATRG
jgi:hypothetical protein